MKPIIWVEGIIGSGKTTLAERLSMRALHEPVESNPYLAPFYQEPKRWAFAMQLHLMAERFGLQQLAVGEALSGERYQGVILDRGLPGDRVFARLHTLEGNISELEWQTYERWYTIMAASLRPPALIIFLDVNPRVAHARVTRRARTAENGLPLEYLEKLHRGYLDLLAEIESGDHAWSRGMQVLRWPWNTDDLPVDPIANVLRRRFSLD